MHIYKVPQVFFSDFLHYFDTSIVIKCLKCFSLTFCIILIQVLLLLTVTLRGVSNKHCLLPFFHFAYFFIKPML